MEAVPVIISVKGLSKIYRVGSEKVTALSGIDLEIPKGQICCIVGTSGSGKSTLLNMLAGLEKPTRGCVSIGGQNISAMNENQLARFRQKNIGFIFQSYNLMVAMSALENVAMPMIFRGIPKRTREKTARRILKEVGLADRMRHKPSQMSGGQQQRVGIARAFVANPKIIFADEPTGNLDTKTTIEVMRMMVRLIRDHNQTMVLVTHDNEIAEYADRIVTLRDGHIVHDKANIPLTDRPGDEAKFFAEALGSVEPAPPEPPGPEGEPPPEPPKPPWADELPEANPEHTLQETEKQRSRQ